MTTVALSICAKLLIYRRGVACKSLIVTVVIVVRVYLYLFLIFIFKKMYWQPKVE